MSARILAIVSLVVALSAGAYAAGLDRNSVKSKHIKDGRVMTQDLADAGVTAAKIADGAVSSSKIPDGAVGSSKIADGAVGSAKLADGSISGADVADDSLTGADIDESSLQGVTAANVDSVGGLQIKEIDYQRPIVNGDVRSIVDFPGIFRIDAQCASVGDGLDLTAFTAVSNSYISMVSNRAVGLDDADAGNFVDMRASRDPDFEPNVPFLIDNQQTSSGIQHSVIQFSTPAGFTATIRMYSAELGNGCKVIGTAVGG